MKMKDCLITVFIGYKKTVGTLEMFCVHSNHTFVNILSMLIVCMQPSEAMLYSKCVTLINPFSTSSRCLNHCEFDSFGTSRRWETTRNN